MEIKKMYAYLNNQLIFLDRTIYVIDDLFMNKESLMLLNNVAPDLFGFIQNIVIDSLILQVSRLVDPENQGKNKDNATFDRLINEIKRNNDKLLYNILEGRFGKLQTIAKQVKNHRDKYIAHLDYHEAFIPRTLEGKVIISMKEYLILATEIIDEVGKYYFGESISSKVVYPKGGTKDLLLALKRAGELKQ